MMKKIGSQIVQLAVKDGGRRGEIIDELWHPIFRYVFKKTLDLKRSISATERAFMSALSELKNKGFANADDFVMRLYQVAKEKSEEKIGFFEKKDRSAFLGADKIAFIKKELKDAEMSMLESKDFARLKKLLRKLAPAERDIVALHYFEHETFEDIAKIFSTTIDEVKKIKSRALDKLEIFMSEEIRRAQM